jgi:NADH:ubiquinone oxidoreductase subunit C
MNGDRMNMDQVVSGLRELLPHSSLDPRQVPFADTFLSLPPEAIRPAVKLLQERFDIHHLSAISGEQAAGAIRLLYHFWQGQGLTLETQLSLQTPRIASLVDLIPGADFYEREVHEMLGVCFEGHPDLAPLLLPDDWEEDPPLRRTPPENQAEDPAEQRTDDDGASL